MTTDQMSIYYRPDDYYPKTAHIYGRMSANAGLLNGVFQYGRRQSLAFYVEEEKHFTHLEEQLTSRFKLMPKSIQPIYYGDVLSLIKYDLYFAADPMLSNAAWARAMLGPNAYSLCGLTHSFSSLTALQEIGKLILAPIEPWDAIICTSHAVKNVIQEIFKQWYDYLRQYRQMSYQSSLQLPVIPLGIHVNEISRLQDKPFLRKKFREKWQIKEDDFVVLFYGRLSYYEKAHPVPMYLALEKLAHRIKKGDSIYCVQAGWFQNNEDLEQYKKTIKIFSPSVRSLFLLDLTEQEKFEMWSGADVFISLVDNIQETFGLTPLEAMANELPVVVSDWDGYKETVRDGVDGFRIPSLMPTSGCGVDLALGYLTNAINYYTYCGLNAQLTAIDINYCVHVLWQLYSSHDLRVKMGKSGREHVINHFDWRQIIKQYDALWDSLTERRLQSKAESHRSLSIPAPLLADPFLTYAGYATHTLKASDLLSLDDAVYERLNEVLANDLSGFGNQQRLAKPQLLAVLDLLKQQGPQTVSEIINYILRIDQTISEGIVVRSLTYLIKYGILKYA